MLEAFALRLAAMLFHMARQETDTLLGVPGGISNLQRLFSDLSTILVDAERNQICGDNGALGNWVSELRDAMYDMDNILDKWQIMYWGEGPSSPSMLESFKISLLFCCCNPGGTYKIGRKIRVLNNRLEDIMQRSQHFNFISKVVGSSRGFYLLLMVILSTGVVGDREQLECAVKHAVRHKKFLLVMDDAWSDRIWNELLRVLLNDGAPGSQVLVTTRNGGVARRMKAQLFHHIDKLNPEDCWSLLKKVVFNDGDKSEIAGLEDIGKDIVRRCDGLPLAVKVVGGLLLSKSRTRGAWMDILGHSAWSLMSGNLNNAVFLSCEELSASLKQCFLQCSLIPKGKVIRRRTIVQMWISEGFVRDDTGPQLPEDLGIEYYKELISRNLLENDTQFLDQSGWIMHDVVRSFAQYVIKDEGLLVSEGKSITSSISNLKHRRLSVSKKEVDCASFKKQKSLRTLMLFGTTRVELKFLLNKFSYLRVLHLQDADVAELPESVCYLRHLRYLGLEGTGITTIPRGIGNLKFLQHMALSRCENLMQLPDSIVKLQHLMSLDIRGTKISSILGGIGKALAIEGLEKAFAGSMVAEAKLSSKSHLISFKLRCGSTFRDKSEVENDRKEYHTQIEEVFADLCPPHCIEEIVLTGYFGHQVPKWMARMAAFQNLRLLVIRDYPCCKQLPSGLGQIPFLGYFWIRHAPSIESIGHAFFVPSLDGDATGTDETSETTEANTGTRQPCHLSCGVGVAFPKLRELVFDQVVQWREWEWDKQVQAMPVLQSLRIECCKLSRLPPGLACQARFLRKLYLVNILHLVSVENFPSLVELHLSQNPELQSVTNNSSLQKIEITNCTALEVLEDLPALWSITWDDLDAETLPEYLREVKINKLDIKCSLRLLHMIY
ncbi:unnamed protein product [Urochloa decumbens]|uniref:Uncharacterized protein n=1 Tax=Urochloa decumbens TaxID=240449 RepID=A0ABC8XMX5_9POAL